MPKNAFGGDKMEKKEIRRHIKSRTLQLSAEECCRQSERATERILLLVGQRQPKTVALFAPLSDEVQIASLAQRLSCRVVLPRVEGDEMEFYDYAEGGMAEGSFGILEPQQGAAAQPSEIDLMVVPGVAFTASGDRLGRGKGYYDRYLSRGGFRAYCVGVCYAHQVVDELPVEPHDRRMDEVISGKEE